MLPQMKPRTPIFTITKEPIWFNPNGSNITETQVSSCTTGPQLILKSNRFEVTIIPAREVGAKWLLRYKISNPDEMFIICDVWMGVEQIKTAFGLSDECEDLPWDKGQWIIDKSGGQFAHEGKYIRWRDFLNVPNPGTGFGGDTNISIRLDNKVKGVITEFLASVFGTPRP